jgi:hypothetical protein
LFGRGPPFQRFRLDRRRHEVARTDRGLEQEPPRGLLLRRAIADESGDALSGPRVRSIEMASHEQLAGADEAGLQTAALEICPLLERRAAGYAETGKEGARVKLDGVAKRVPLESRDKAIAVRLDGRAERKLFVAGEGSVAEQTAQMEDRLAQRAARAFRFQVRPEQLDERLARRTPTRRQREVHEQREWLSRSEYRLRAGGAEEAHDTERSECERGVRLR